jgi:hypothetical protein
MVSMNESVESADHRLQRDRAGLILALVVPGFLAANLATAFLLKWLFPNADNATSCFWAGMIVLQPMLMAVWTALGAGGLAKRLVTALASLLALLIAPGLVPSAFDGFTLLEFITYVSAGVVIFFVTLIGFLILRRWRGLRIGSRVKHRGDASGRMQFTIKHAMLLTTLCAVSCGAISQIRFEDPQSQSVFGPNFMITIVVMVGSGMFAAVLPPLAVPLFMLRRGVTRRAIVVAAGCWLSMSALFVLTCYLLDTATWPGALSFLLYGQAGAIVVGVLTAWPLRLAGLRLEGEVMDSSVVPEASSVKRDSSLRSE